MDHILVPAGPRSSQLNKGPEIDISDGGTAKTPASKVVHGYRMQTGLSVSR